MGQKEFYILRIDRQLGPFALEELGAAGIERDTRVFRLGADGFVNAEEIKEINDYYFTRKKADPFPPHKGKPADVPEIDMDKVREAAERYRERKLREEAAAQAAKAQEEAAAVTQVTDSFAGGNSAEGFTNETIVSENVAVPPPPPVDPVTPVTPVNPVPEPVQPVNPALTRVDAKVFGNPTAVPAASIFLTIIYCLIYLVAFGVYHSSFFSLWSINLYIMFIPPIAFTITALILAARAKKCYLHGAVSEACKKSGAATAFGWCSILYCVLCILREIYFIYFGSL